MKDSDRQAWAEITTWDHGPEPEREREPRTSITVNIHADGPAVASMVTGDGFPRGYAVLSLKGGTGITGATIFPDDTALDTIISECMRVRSELRAYRAVQGARVSPLSDDSPVPLTGTIVERVSDEWVMVLWDGAKEPEREAHDELVPAR